jgi:KDO2-lipid IV(A) lauroyltransferase
VTERDRRLEAPHRRLQSGSRLAELAAVRAYRATSWLIGRIPPRLARALIGRSAQVSYLLWPRKRHWSSANFGHVLGLDRSDRRVHRLALSAYREYARYIVEVMRLPFMEREDAARMVDQASIDPIEDLWRSSDGIIFALGHVGNNEAVAAAVAQRGWPLSVVADDSAYPELFEDFRRLREGWGIHVIPWRNLREIFGVLRRKEMLALLVDWGYRSDGIPVRLFDAWTALPAGPATLAAKTGALIVPVTIRRDAGDRFHVSWAEPIRVASSAPADLARATQALADALQTTIAAAPHQWYSFKPIWPATAEEGDALHLRAETMLAQETAP